MRNIESERGKRERERGKRGRRRGRGRGREREREIVFVLPSWKLCVRESISTFSGSYLIAAFSSNLCAFLLLSPAILCQRCQQQKSRNIQKTKRERKREKLREREKREKRREERRKKREERREERRKRERERSQVHQGKRSRIHRVRE